MRRTHSLDGAYFDALYAADPDPWRFGSSPYEAAKYDDTIVALEGQRAQSALEVGCSIGVLTRRLAACCDRLVATDVAAAALDEARRCCSDLINVEFRLARSAGDAMHGRFDLIVLSEVVYYWDDCGISSVAGAIEASLVSGGRLMLVHWLGETDYPKSADDAVGALRAALGGVVCVQISERRKHYRLDVWRRAPLAETRRKPRHSSTTSSLVRQGSAG
jgi:SAM-dependent methyltransferase